MRKWDAVAAGYASLWGSAELRPERVSAARVIAQRIIAHKGDYLPVEAATGWPWYFVGCLHSRESDLNFATVLANGQSLKRVTTEVPAGLGPFPDFATGAIASIRYELRGKPLLVPPSSGWSPPFMCYVSEEYNGEGYESRGVNSPYVWSWTNHEQVGKFSSDGHFNPSLRDPQCGVAAILLALFAIQPDLLKGAPPVATPIPTPATPLPPFHLPDLKALGPAIDSILSVLPTVALFFPPLRALVPFIPLIRGLMGMVDDLEAAGHDPAAIASVVAGHLHDIAEQVKGAVPPTT